MEFFPEITLSDEEGELIARGMLAVARADGQVHDREIGLVQGFFGEVGGGAPASLAAIEREADIDAKVLAAGLGREAVGMLFIKSCILLAFADGAYHEKERAKIEEYATALGIGADALGELEQSVKEFLLGQLTDLNNRDAAVTIAKELGIL